MAEVSEDPSMEEVKDSREGDQKRGPVYKWQPITDEFFESVQELELGELLHYELFGLFEAMSAIEMMDKKMDIGMLEGGKKNVPLTFDLAVKVFLEILRLSNKNLIGIYF